MIGIGASAYGVSRSQTPRSMIVARTAGGIAAHISASVKSTAGAISTMPARRWAASAPSARATSSAIQPPMDEPTRIWGPRVRSRSAASASSLQALIEPSSNAPDEAPWPE